jgi:hypothetical protein
MKSATLVRLGILAVILAAAGMIPANGVHAQSTITLTVPSVQTPTLGGPVPGAAASETAGNSYIINIAPGTYSEDSAIFNAPTVINAVGVTITAGPPTNFKALLTTTFPLTVNGMTMVCSGCALAENLGGNGAAVREQANGANTLVLNGVTIVGFQDGVLTGSDSGNTHLDHVTVIDSLFANNGDPVNGQTHGLYIGDAATATISGSTFCGTNLGHDIKSRAAQTTVTNSTMFVGTNQGAPTGCNVGSASLAVDMPNGGTGLVDRSNIYQGDANQNGALIAYGEEGLVFTANSLSVTRTLFDNFGPNKSSIGIHEFTDPCPAAVNGINTDRYITAPGTSITPVSPSDCLAAGSHHIKNH